MPTKKNRATETATTERLRARMQRAAEDYNAQTARHTALTTALSTLARCATPHAIAEIRSCAAQQDTAQPDGATQAAELFAFADLLDALVRFDARAIGDGLERLAQHATPEAIARLRQDAAYLREDRSGEAQAWAAEQEALADLFAAIAAMRGR